MARPPFTHGGKHGLRHPQRTQGVELEESFDLRERDALQGRAHGFAGVADQYVDVAGVPDGLVDALLVVLSRWCRKAYSPVRRAEPAVSNTG